MTTENHRGQRKTAANMRLASCGVKCLNSSAVFQFNFSAGLTVLCSEIPHERQAQKRCTLLNPGLRKYLLEGITD